jgi:hypothetical protein
MKHEQVISHLEPLEAVNRERAVVVILATGVAREVQNQQFGQVPKKGSKLKKRPQLRRGQENGTLCKPALSNPRCDCFQRTAPSERTNAAARELLERHAKRKEMSKET